MGPGELEQLAGLLRGLGCPGERSGMMAEQLAKRAAQLAVEKKVPETEALAHLLRLMRQGWAAKERGLDGGASPPPRPE